MRSYLDDTSQLTEQELRAKRDQTHNELIKLQIELSDYKSFINQLRKRVRRELYDTLPPLFYDAAARTHGVNRTELAKLYGIDRSTLYRRLQPIVHLLPMKRRQRFTLEELALIYMELGIPSGLNAPE